MAVERKLKINFLNPNNKSGSMTVSNINSDTSTTALRNYSTGLISLTDNTYISTTKIDEEKID